MDYFYGVFLCFLSLTALKTKSAKQGVSQRCHRRTIFASQRTSESLLKHFLSVTKLLIVKLKLLHYKDPFVALERFLGC